jgi:hypothetical protein
VNHVSAQPSTTSAPPRPAVAPSTAIPQWPTLKPEIRESLVALLTRMLQQHLLARNAAEKKEVADESC